MRPAFVLSTIVVGVTYAAAPANPSVVDALRAISRWPARRWAAAAAGTAGAALLIGVPTAVLPTGLFRRMTPVLWWNYPVWVVTAALVGLTLATYLRSVPGSNRARGGRVTIGGLLSAFAVGCPLCNKLVVVALGASGAVTIWAPIQPILAVVAVSLLAYTLVRRLRGEISCPAPGPRAR